MINVSKFILFYCPFIYGESKNPTFLVDTCKCSNSGILIQHSSVHVCPWICCFLFVKKIKKLLFFQISSWSHITNLCNMFVTGLKYSLNWRTWILKGKPHSFSWEEMWDFLWKLKKRSALDVLVSNTGSETESSYQQAVY